MEFIVQTAVEFWVFIPCNVFGLLRRFGGAYCLQLQGELRSGGSIHMTQNPVGTN